MSVSDPSRDIPLPRSWPMVNNQADVAKQYGISRARVTQYLNLLRLPDEIIDYLKAKNDQESVLRYFTERRLRELTRLKGNERRVKRFRKMVEQAAPPFKMVLNIVLFKTILGAATFFFN